MEIYTHLLLAQVTRSAFQTVVLKVHVIIKLALKTVDQMMIAIALYITYAAITNVRYIQVDTVLLVLLFAWLVLLAQIIFKVMGDLTSTAAIMDMKHAILVSCVTQAIVAQCLQQLETVWHLAAVLAN